MTNLPYASLYAMAPLGGLFIALIGISVVLGSVFAKQRMLFVYIGFGVASLAIVFGGRLTQGLSHPTILQVMSLVAAIAFEVIAFRIFMPRLRKMGQRDVLVGTLGIVGAHFLIMEPAFGPAVAVLGVVCILNAVMAWRLTTYSSESAWALDGFLKLACGVGLLMTSPVL